MKLVVFIIHVSLHLYRQFLRKQERLLQQAEERNKKGKPGDPVPSLPPPKNYLIKFTLECFGIIGLRCKSLDL